MYRLDKISNGGDNLLYVRKDIPSTLLNTDFFFGGSCIETNIRRKRLLVCTCNLNKNLISNYLKEIGNNLDNYSSKYNNFIILGDAISEPTESAVWDFCQIYGCKNLIKDRTCFKNSEKNLQRDWNPKVWLNGCNPSSRKNVMDVIKMINRNFIYNHENLFGILVF